MRTRTFSSIAAAAALTLTLAACGDDASESSDAGSEMTETDAAESPQEAEAGSDTIVDIAASSEDFTTLVAAVQAAGLVETLSGEGPYTVFAPTDEAFAAALESLGITAEELLADTETLTSILTYHVVAGEVPSTDVVTLDGQSVATVNGAEIEISIDGDMVMVDDAMVTAVDLDASNGIIHVIDSVLLP